MLHIAVSALSLPVPLDEPYSLISIEILVPIMLDGNLPLGNSMEISWIRWARHQNWHGVILIFHQSSLWHIQLLYPDPITTQPKSLTHWGRVTHICASKITIIGSDYGVLPSRRSLGMKKMHLKIMSSAKWRQFCLGLDVSRKTYQPVIVPSPVK